MAAGDFTKAEAQAAEEALKDIIRALPKSKKMELLGSANDVFLFIAAAKRAAPGTP